MVQFLLVQLKIQQCVVARDVDATGDELDMQSQEIRDCQLTASESPIAGQQAKDARLGGSSGRHICSNTRPICAL